MDLLRFLQFLGLEPFYKSNEAEIWQKIFNWVYPLLIWLLLLFHPILLTTISLKTSRVEILPSVLFLFIQPIQYHIAFWYFKSQKHKRLYESTNLEFLRDDRRNSSIRYLPTQNALLKMIVFSSIFFIIMSLIVFIIVVLDDDSYYKEISQGLQIFGYIIIPTSLIYGKTILTLNTYIFVFSFLQQIQKMDGLSDKLSKKRWTEGENLSVATLCYEIFDIRYTVSRMINKLGDMYTYTTILGSTALGLVFSLGAFNYQVFASGSLFLIMQVFFLMIIQAIGMKREEFKDIIRHRKFASAYILRRNEFCQACIQVQASSNEKELFNDMDVDINNLIDVTPNPSGILQPLSNVKGDIKKVLEDNLKSSKKDIGKSSSIESPNPANIGDLAHSSSIESPNPAGIGDLANSIEEQDAHVVEIIEERIDDKINYKRKSFGGIQMNNSGIFPLENEETETETLDESDDIRQHIQNLLKGEIGDPHTLADSGCRLTTDEFIRCIYEWVTNTGSTIDWIVLNSILNDDWSSFGMFGIEFSDGSALRKAIYSTIVLVGTGTIVGFIEGLQW